MCLGSWFDSVSAGQYSICSVPLYSSHSDSILSAWSQDCYAMFESGGSRSSLGLIHCFQYCLSSFVHGADLGFNILFVLYFQPVQDIHTDLAIICHVVRFHPESIKFDGFEWIPLATWCCSRFGRTTLSNFAGECCLLRRELSFVQIDVSARFTNLAEAN